MSRDCSGGEAEPRQPVGRDGVAPQDLVALVGVHAGGGSDGNFTAALGVPTLDGLGVDGAGAHTLQEHIFVSSIEPRVDLFAALLAETKEEDVGSRQ
jgi:hypothetical protein